MYKASAGVLLPTSIIGSLPRPAWHTVQLGSRSFLEAMVNARWREQYEEAVSTHPRAGDGGAQHLHRRRRPLRRRDRRVELAELSADPHGRVFARGSADPVGGRRRLTTARGDLARAAR